MANHSHTNPKIIGPGWWSRYHLKARQATTLERINRFIEDDAYWIRDNFPCLKCRKDTKEYMNENDIRLYIHIKDEFSNFIGMFKYTWMQHNWVNAKLGKKLMDWETALRLYDVDEDGVCTKDCDASENASENTHEEASGNISKSGSQNISRNPRYEDSERYQRNEYSGNISEGYRGNDYQVGGFSRTTRSSIPREQLGGSGRIVVKPSYRF